MNLFEWAIIMGTNCDSCLFSFLKRVWRVKLSCNFAPHLFVDGLGLYQRTMVLKTR